MQVISYLWIGLNYFVLHCQIRGIFMSDIGWSLILEFTLFVLVGIWRQHLLVATELVSGMWREKDHTPCLIQKLTLKCLSYTLTFSEILAVTLCIFWNGKEFKPCTPKTVQTLHLWSKKIMLSVCFFFYFLNFRNILEEVL